MSILLGGASAVQNVSAFDYNETYNLEELAENDESLLTTGDGLTYNLLPRTSAAGGIQPNADFFTNYEGFITLSTNTALEVVMELRFKHEFGDQPQFISRRQYRARLSNNGEATIPLVAFNSITNIPLGTFETRDGTTITVTAADLRNITHITLDVNIKGFATGQSSGRKAATLDVTSAFAKVKYFQLRQGDSVPSDIIPAPRQFHYGIWNRTTEMEVSGKTGTAEFYRLPTSVSFVSPTADATSNRAWFIRFPSGVYYRHIHFQAPTGHLDDPDWTLDQSYTGDGRRIISNELGSGAITDTVPIVIDLVSLS